MRLGSGYLSNQVAAWPTLRSNCVKTSCSAAGLVKQLCEVIERLQRAGSWNSLCYPVV